MDDDGSRLFLQKAYHVRQGWDEHFAAMAAAGDDRLLDEEIRSQWDENEWEW